MPNIDLPCPPPLPKSIRSLSIGGCFLWVVFTAVRSADLLVSEEFQTGFATCVTWLLPPGLVLLGPVQTKAPSHMNPTTVCALTSTHIGSVATLPLVSNSPRIRYE